MTTRRFPATFFALLILPLTAHSQEEVIRFGVIDTLFQGKDEKAILSQMEPFADLIRKRTKVNGEFLLVRGVDEMGRQLREGKIQLAVLHGIEYGWLRPQNPDARTLVVAVNETTDLKAYLLVSKDSTAQSVTDLKGQSLILPPRPPHHTRLFLDRLLPAPREEFFKVAPEAKNAEAALEAVIDGSAKLTVVSNVVWNAYRSRKPGRSTRLKVLQESPSFPAAVVVYRPGRTREKALQQFRDSLLRANETIEGRQTLTLWRLTGFQEIPQKYEEQVEAIVKRYPAAGK